MGSGSHKNGPTVMLDPSAVERVRKTRTLADFAHDLGVDVEAARNALNGRPVLRRTWKAIATLGALAPESLLATHAARELLPSLPEAQQLRETMAAVAQDTELGRAEIEVLAERCGLFCRWRINPHLTYTTGDIAYWAEQRGSTRRASNLWANLLGRAMMLKCADEESRFYPAQGDLSAASAPLIAQLLSSVPSLWR